MLIIVLKANSKIGPYRRKIVIENREDIYTLFSQDRADGQGAKTHQAGWSKHDEYGADYGLGAVKYECIHTYFHGAVNICKLKIKRNQVGLLNV